ncbi:transducin beta-like protein 3 [Eurytemora carolleeae]|uniref:transducin beta-like protein 3 n=1 Tax=Eurytemora carolleeae TaxID=1294199 RepID=UPI000C75F6AB|nr:transducin beta-like protein 3 [Eurytemora carolleeae]|eukprot:XP_023345007.1 transducin beta-like protein 3 [Eurytemora affinis]
MLLNTSLYAKEAALKWKLLESNVGSEISTLQSYKDNIYAATADQNLLSFCPEDLSITNTVVGNNDEILALVHLGSSASSPSTPSSSHMAVACNSPFIRLYKVPEYTCTLLHGHKDTVLCLAVSTQDPTLLASGGKDREVRIWRLKADLLSCLVVGTGHTEAVQGIVFTNLASTSLYSVSKDTTVKFWNVNYEAGQMSSLRTEIAHEKEINCCDVSPGDEMLATGSQDKTCKLWDKNLTLTVTLRGHKRGIWCVRFSPADRLLATGSADGLIKLWSLTENVCVKQLEGHDCSVLSLVWINDQQIASSATDGLIKIWLVSKQECVTTLEQHEEKVWTITSLKQDGVLNLVSGSADGQLITWRDITESAALLKQVAAEKIVLSQQKLSNLLASKQFGQALKLALRLSQPFTALKILKKLNMEEMEKAVLSLDNASIDQLLGYTVKWNTNSKHCEAAQSALFIILSNYLPDDLLKLSGSRDWVEGLLPYTEKHFQRLSRLQMKSKFTTFLISNIKATAIPQQENEL